MTELETFIRELTVPRNGAYPRPWTTGADDTDPSQADVLIVGASSAKTFPVEKVGSHDRYIDAHWNRNGETCRALYAAATEGRSRTRPNLERLSAMLAAHGLTSLQTNVACSSAPYDKLVFKEDRVHGTDIFKIVVQHVPWKAMIVYGVGACKSFGRALGADMPPVPSPDSAPVSTMVSAKPVFLSPTLAPPGYNSTVWRYLERVVEEIGAGPRYTASPRANHGPSAVARPIPTQHRRESVLSSEAPNTPKAFNNSAANRKVWQRMQEIDRRSGLRICISDNRARLDGPLYRNTKIARVFRHEFNEAKPEILVRDDVFEFATHLRQAAPWTRYKKVFQKLRTADLQLLDRALDAVEAFAKVRAP